MLETLKHIHVRIKEGMLKDMIRQINTQGTIGWP